ncbi:MAG TPA: hypothetical protein VHD76_04190 [Bryobacteraceae bacterium]|nr:hypothetical protein [Bryobacteraceae bacterium]
MQKYLLVDAKQKEGEQVRAYLPGEWFLMLCQAATDTLKGSIGPAVLAATTPKEPFVIQNFQDWVDIWRAMAACRGQDILEARALYFRVAERLIVKRARYHNPADVNRDRMKDRITSGPAEAKSQDVFFQERVGAAKKEREQRIEALRYQILLAEDEARSKKAKGGSKKMEPPEEPRNNPFVKSYASLPAPGLKFELEQLTREEKLPEHGGDGYYMADANYSGLLPQRVWARYEGASYPDFRAYLAGLFGEADKKLDQSMAEGLRVLIEKPQVPPRNVVGREVLPLLACVMLIAEPARQPRTFLNGLLAVDLLGTRYGAKAKKTYSVQRMIGFPGDTFSTGKGGKLAAARTGSAANPDYTSDEEHLPALTEVTHQREASTLIRWLCLDSRVAVDNWDIELSAPGSKYMLEADRTNLLIPAGDKQRELMWKLRVDFQTRLEKRLHHAG